MSSAAERMRRMRQRLAREREGFFEFTAEAQINRLVLALVEDGYLDDECETDRLKIDAAFQKMVEAFIVVMIGPQEESEFNAHCIDSVTP